MRLMGLFLVLFASQNALAIDCNVETGTYVPEEVNDQKCAYYVSDSWVDPHTTEPSCGAMISFVNDPRYPDEECPASGVNDYPIGITVESITSFLDARGSGSARFTLYEESL